MSDNKIATDINEGKCMFCSGDLYYCSKEGKMAKEVTDWVVCENNDCMPPGSCINAIQYSAPDKCDECEVEPDCDCDDCEDSDSEDDDDSSSGESTLDEGTTQAIVNKLNSLTKSAILVDGKFQPVDEEVMRETIKEVLSDIEGNTGIAPDA